MAGRSLPSSVLRDRLLKEKFMLLRLRVNVAACAVLNCAVCSAAMSDIGVMGGTRRASFVLAR